MPQAPQLSFLDKVMLKNPSGKSQHEKVVHVKKRPYQRKESTTVNGIDFSETTFLDPVLSLSKIDGVPINKSTRKPGRPPRSSTSAPHKVSPRKSTSKSYKATSKKSASEQYEVAVTRGNKSISYKESSSEDELDNESDSRKSKYRYDVHVASTQRHSPYEQTSTFASLSFENGGRSDQRKEIVPAYNVFDGGNEGRYGQEHPESRRNMYDAYHDSRFAPPRGNPESRRMYDGYHESRFVQERDPAWRNVYDERFAHARSYSPSRTVALPQFYDVPRDSRLAPEKGGSPPPPTLKRQEYHDSRLPMVPADYTDEDMAFFRSLLTWTKGFSEHEKLEFRMEVMKLVSRMRSYDSAGNYYVLSQTPM